MLVFVNILGSVMIRDVLHNRGNALENRNGLNGLDMSQIS